MTSTINREAVIRSERSAVTGKAPAGTTPTGTPTAPKTTSKLVQNLLVVLRLAFAWEFLWAFADKLFGFGFATPSERSWINGGSPTRGFLTNSASGPFESFYKSIAGDTWTDWLFMLGLLGIGAALLFGVGMRIAAAAGTLLLVMMWSVALPPDTNPFMDTHLLEALVLILLAATYAGDRFGFGRWWGNTRLVRAFPALR